MAKGFIDAEGRLVVRKQLAEVALKEALVGRAAMPENVLVDVGGLCLYLCETDEDSPTFPNGVVARIGVILWEPLELSGPNGRGLSIKWHGIRLGQSKDRISYKPLDRPHKWEARGHLSLVANQLTIEHALFDASGSRWATDRLEREEDSGDWRGTFLAEPAKKAAEVIHGVVRHVQLGSGRTRPPEFTGVALRLAEALDSELIAMWGRKLYDRLPAKEKATPDEPYVLIDIVSGNHVRTSEERRGEVAAGLRNEHPDAVIYRAEMTPRRLSLGAGALR